MKTYLCFSHNCRDRCFFPLTQARHINFLERRHLCGRQNFRHFDLFSKMISCSGPGFTRRIFFLISSFPPANLYPYLPPRIFLIAVWGNWFMYESHFVLDLCLCWRQAYINASLRICYCFSHLIGLFSVT